jgi:hypothetical protein
MPGSRLTSRLMEACITGATIGIAEFLTSSAIRSVHGMHEISLRAAVIIGTPIGVAIGLAVRAFLKSKGSDTRPDSLAAKLQPRGRDHPESVPDNYNYLTEAWAAQLWVNRRTRDQLPLEDSEATEDPDVTERQR